RQHEIAMEGMDQPVRPDGTLGCYQRLRDGLAAEDTLPFDLGTATTKQVVFQPLEVENGEKLLHGNRHCFAPFLERDRTGAGFDQAGVKVSSGGRRTW